MVNDSAGSSHTKLLKWFIITDMYVNRPLSSNPPSPSVPLLQPLRNLKCITPPGRTPFIATLWGRGTRFRALYSFTRRRQNFSALRLPLSPTLPALEPEHHQCCKAAGRQHHLDQKIFPRLSLGRHSTRSEFHGQGLGMSRRITTQYSPASVRSAPYNLTKLAHTALRYAVYRGGLYYLLLRTLTSSKLLLRGHAHRRASRQLLDRGMYGLRPPPWLQVDVNRDTDTSTILEIRGVYVSHQRVSRTGTSA